MILFKVEAYQCNKTKDGINQEVEKAKLRTTGGNNEPE